MSLKPSSSQGEPGLTHSIHSGWTPNRNFTFSSISPTCLVSSDSDNHPGGSNTAQQPTSPFSSLSVHRPILKSASANDLTLRVHHPTKPIQTSTRRRASCHPLVFHPSPPRSSILVGIECKLARTLTIVDEAMGIKRLPNRHCDPTSPLPPFSGAPAYPPSQIDEESEQLLSPNNSCWHPHIAYDEEDQEDEKIPPKPFGVLKMEAIAVRLRSGNGWGVRSVYVAMCLLSTVTSIENNSLPVVEPYYLSLFGGHSALSTIGIITSIAWAVGKPPMSKVMDVFGRAEGVMIATVLYFIGAILTSSATSVTQYGIARIASALGSQGLQLAQMILVADTSSLASRALLTSTISSPWIFTTWIGPVIGAKFKQMGEFGYRIIYAVFGIIVPFCAMWLVGVLWWEWKALRRANALSHHMNWGPPPADYTCESSASRKKSHDVHSQHSAILSPDVQMSYHPRQRRHSQALLDDHFRGRSTTQELWTQTWSELDVIGILMLTLGFGMMLLPLSFGNNTTRNWAPGVFYGLLSGGVLILLIFSRYESKHALYPIIPTRLLKQRTIILGSSVCFWHFMCQYIYESYFTSFLQVVRLSSPRDAQYIQESYIFTACISALLCGVLVQWSRRYKIWVIVGVLVHSIGAMLMLRARNLDNPITEIVISQVIAGFGGGFTTLASQLGVQAVVSHQDVGIATAVFLTVTQIGGAIGSSMAGAVWNSMLPFELRKRLPPQEHNKIDRIVGDLDYILSFPNGSALRESINASYVEAQRMLNILALVALFPCLLSGLFMENVDLSGPSEVEATSIPSERSSLLSPQREPTPSREQLPGTSAT